VISARAGQPVRKTNKQNKTKTVCLTRQNLGNVEFVEHGAPDGPPPDDDDDGDAIAAVAAPGAGGEPACRAAPGERGAAPLARAAAALGVPRAALRAALTTRRVVVSSADEQYVIGLGAAAAAHARDALAKVTLG